MTKEEALKKLELVDCFIYDIGREFSDKVDWEDLEAMRKILVEVDSYIFNTVKD